MTSTTAIWCYLLLVAVLLPWIELHGLKFSVFNFYKLSEMLGAPLLNLFYLIPMAVLAILYLGVKDPDRYGDMINLITFIPGMSLLVLLFIINGRVELLTEKFEESPIAEAYGFFIGIIAIPLLWSQSHYTPKP